MSRLKYFHTGIVCINHAKKVIIKMFVEDALWFCKLSQSALLKCSSCVDEVHIKHNVLLLIRKNKAYLRQAPGCACQSAQGLRGKPSVGIGKSLLLRNCR